MFTLNTTSWLQPLDAGIIRNFKLKYKTRFVQWLLDQLSVGRSNEKLGVLSAMRMVVKAWEEVIPETVRHCWIHTKIVSVPTAADLRQQDEPREQIDLSGLVALLSKLALADKMDADEYLTCDDDLDEWDPHLIHEATEDIFG